MGAGFLVSKLLKELKKAPQKAAAIANGEKERLFKFAVVGGSGLLLKLILMGLGVELLGISQYIVIFPAALIVNASNFTLNTLWTFKGFNPGIKGYFKYLGLNAISFIGYMGVYYTFLATGQHYLMAGFYGVCTIGLINFALSRLKSEMKPYEREYSLSWKEFMDKLMEACKDANESINEPNEPNEPKTIPRSKKD